MPKLKTDQVKGTVLDRSPVPLTPIETKIQECFANARKMECSKPSSLSLGSKQELVDAYVKSKIMVEGQRDIFAQLIENLDSAIERVRYESNGRTVLGLNSEDFLPPFGERSFVEGHTMQDSAVNGSFEAQPRGIAPETEFLEKSETNKGLFGSICSFCSRLSYGGTASRYSASKAQDTANSSESRYVSSHSGDIQAAYNTMTGNFQRIEAILNSSARKPLNEQDNEKLNQALSQLIMLPMEHNQCYQLSIFSKREQHVSFTSGDTATVDETIESLSVRFGKMKTSLSPRFPSVEPHTPDMKRSVDRDRLQDTDTGTKDEALKPLRNKSGKPKASPSPPTSRVFKPYIPYKGMSVNKLLEHKLNQPLPSKDKGSEINGLIYIYKDVYHSGHVKIGLTKNLEQRLDAQTRVCGRLLRLCFPKEGQQSICESPHIHRVENLIHSELREIRKQCYCDSCNANHREWFEVQDEIALDVVKKWLNWMRQEERYEEEEGGGRGERYEEEEEEEEEGEEEEEEEEKERRWCLKPMGSKFLEEICKPDKRILDLGNYTHMPMNGKEKRKSRKSTGLFSMYL